MKLRLKFALALGTVLAIAPNAQAQSFGNVYGFGDSLTDNGASTRIAGIDWLRFDTPATNPLWTQQRATNGLNWYDRLSGKIGAVTTLTSDRAISGAISGSFPGQNGNGSIIGHPYFTATLPQTVGKIYPGLIDQVGGFVRDVGRLRPNDLATFWIGTNDFSLLPLIGLTPAQGAAYVNGNLKSGIQQLAAIGGRNFVVINLNSTQQPNSELRKSFNSGLPVLLTPLSQSGLNIHLFDFDTLLKNMRSNPVAYGLAPDAGTVLCNNLPSCRSGATTDQYITFENVHFTARTNEILASYIANQLNAPLTIGPQGELGQSAGMAFSSTLIDFLSAERRRNMAMSVPAMYSADLPGKTPPPVTIPVQTGSPVSLFALGTYVNADRSAQNRASGGTLGNTFSADFGGVTAGALYQATPNLVLGAAFNYLNTSVDLRGRSNGRIDLDSFQGAAFASYSTPGFFADGVVTYGANNYTVSRPGVMNDRLTAAPSGDTVTVAARVGYLFDFDSFKIGPVGEMSYAHVNVDPYSERGDSLLSIGVKRQSLEGLTAGGGVQVRTVAPLFGGIVSPFLNITAQHGFLDGVRTVTSFQTYAPTLLIRTQTGRLGDDVYGQVAGGLDFDLGRGFSGVLTGSTSFARSGGDDRTVSAGLRYRF